MPGAERGNFDRPHELREFPHIRIDFLKLGGEAVRRITLQPGFRWSKDVGPVAGTEWCEAEHFQYHVSGRLHVVISDGTALELGPGDMSYLPRGHDSWVVGDEPVVLVDWHKASRAPKTWT